MSDPADILAWRRIDARVTTSGQPDAAQLGELAALGVARIVNLALRESPGALADEAAQVAALGMAYVHIPVAFDAPQEGDHRRFIAAMAAAEGEAVHVHCAVNARVSAFLYRWRRERGVAEAAARAALETVWRPGGVWARFIGDADAEQAPHAYAGRDY